MTDFIVGEWTWWRLTPLVCWLLMIIGIRRTVRGRK